MAEKEKETKTVKKTTSTAKKTSTTKTKPAAAKTATTKSSSVKKPATKTTTVKKTTVKKESAPLKKEEVTEEKNIVNEIKDELAAPIRNDVNDKTKAYKVLSYIGILWIIGLFVPEKNDKNLRFHVGQGIILTIATLVLEVIVALINNILIANIFRVATYSYYYGTTYAVSGFGAAIQGILNLAVWVITLIYVIIGIKNAIPAIFPSS